MRGYRATRPRPRGAAATVADGCAYRLVVSVAGSLVARAGLASQQRQQVGGEVGGAAEPGGHAHVERLRARRRLVRRERRVLRCCQQPTRLAPQEAEQHLVHLENISTLPHTKLGLSFI